MSRRPRRSVTCSTQLSAVRPFRVQVVEAGAKPLPGVHVLAQEGDLRRAHGVTDREGRVTLSGLGPGPFGFEVREPDGFRPYEVVSYEEEPARLTVRLP